MPIRKRSTLSTVGVKTGRRPWRKRTVGSMTGRSTHWRAASMCRAASMMTGFRLASSGNGVQASGYTVPDRVATHLFPTFAGTVHHTGEGIHDRFSLAVLGPGAGTEALAAHITVVHVEGQRPTRVVQTARSTTRPLLAERDHQFLQTQAREGLPAPAVNVGRGNNRG